MAEYAIGDRVKLSDECGGSTGWIDHWSGGPRPEGTFHLHADWHAPRLEGATSAGPNQIAALLDPPPAYEVGAQVTLGGVAGEIVEDWGDGRYLVEVLVELTRARGRAFFGRTATRRLHLVPGWRLAAR
jgi:hypothetical protein